MSFNLADDFRKRFSLNTSIPQTPVTKPIPAPAEEEPITPELDLVVSNPPPVKEKEPSPATWETNVSPPITIPSVANISAPKTKRQSPNPVVIGNKQFFSSATANWASIRKAVYPLYKDFCISQGSKPTIYEFNALIGPRWKGLSAEDKAKAVADPSKYFTF